MKHDTNNHVFAVKLPYKTENSTISLNKLNTMNKITLTTELETNTHIKTYVYEPILDSMICKNVQSIEKMRSIFDLPVKK